MMKKVLVTGATGFLGGSLVERLLAHGEHNLRVTVRPGSRRERVLAAAAKYPDAQVEFVEANLIAAKTPRVPSMVSMWCITWRRRCGRSRRHVPQYRGGVQVPAGGDRNAQAHARGLGQLVQWCTAWPSWGGGPWSTSRLPWKPIPKSEICTAT